VVSSQPQCAETQEVENLITESLPSNCCLHDTSRTALFRLPGVMSHICLYGIVMSIPSGSTIPANPSWGGGGIHRQQGDLISLLLFFQNKESMSNFEVVFDNSQVVRMHTSRCYAQWDHQVV
jgi:hypothetical protein